jgi:hypothetical protein
MAFPGYPGIAEFLKEDRVYQEKHFDKIKAAVC